MDLDTLMLSIFIELGRMPLTDYMNVSANNVKSIGRAFYLQGQQGNIGVWHVLPKTLSSDYREKGVHPAEEEMEKSLSIMKFPVVLYLHGNSFDRAISHRVELYNVLSKMDYHVVAFDYRALPGYGDSDGCPSEPGLVNDAYLVYNYVKSHCGNNAVIIWGHSMGSGVGVKLTMDLSIEGRPSHGLVLESPFNNLHDVLLNHSLSLSIRWLPENIIQSLIILPLRKVGLVMESDKRIANVCCPILIMHAADDHVIPVKLARRLREAGRCSSRDVRYVEFDEARNYRHKFIYMAPELTKIIPDFVAHCKEVRGVAT
ncbi:hypothetical protein DICVIV_00126 [Dictyocaulus viviparus]|uniref:Serine aminopeptidase S33 domain-containing protein n=1 Tax=Dictyocaulus viviparus TaxID=29172 RepID=A0A0D8YBY5_DICVI|nr:hypothetical protein DICVIV_00126 [Dictyocaulus viviparus]